MCFRPPQNTKLLLQLEQQRDSLEHENSQLRQKLELQISQQQLKTSQHQQEKQSWTQLRASLETSCMEKTRVLVACLSQASQLSSELQAYLQQLQHKQKTDTGSESVVGRVVAVEVQCHEDACDAPCEPLDRGVARSVVPESEGAEEDVLPPEQRVERVMGALAAQHAALLGSCTTLSTQQEQLLKEGTDLRKDLAALRSQKEALEAKAKSQQEVLEVRCSALESSNASLHDLNTDVQTQLERLQKQLASASEARSTSQDQITRLRSDAEAAHARADAADAELRATQMLVVSTKEEVSALERQLGEAKARAEAAADQVSKLRTTITERDSEVASLKNALADASKQLEHQADEITAARAAGKEAAQRAMAAEAELAEIKAALTMAKQQAASQSYELEAAARRLADAKRSTEELDSWLKKMERELAEAQSQATDANNQYLAVKKELVQTSQQLASIAKDHTKALDAVAGSGDALQVATAELQEARTQLAATKQDVTALTSRAADAERAASTAAQELESVSRATDALRAQLACKRALLTAIVKLCAHKKAAGEGTHDAISAIYNVALSEGCMRLRLCDVPLALLGSLAAGVADSGALTKLVIDMDASREMVWEKAALRVTCLASALALNTSLRSVELIGWTWDEAGSGLAAPFLTLGAVPGTPGPAAARAGSLPGGGSSGAVAAMLPPPPAFTYIQIDTRLFDASCAAMLSDLLQRGLVDLMRPGGIGVVRLYTDHEAIDEWYGEMIQHATMLPDGRSAAAARAARTSPRDILADLMAPGRTVAGSQYGSGSIAGDTSVTGSRYAPSVSAPGAPPSVASSVRYTHQLLSPSSISHGGAVSTPAPSVAGSSMGQQLQQLGGAMHYAASAVGSVAGGRAASVASSSSHSSRAVSAAGTTVGARTAAPIAVQAMDCDLSNEGLESHHMVLVMVVLQACTHLRRLHLDGNKIGDSGAEVVALGLAANSGLLELSLARNGVRRDGARKLGLALEANTCLTRLDLGTQRYGGVGPQGTEALAGALRSNTTLTDLDVRENGIGPSGAAALALALRGANGLRRLCVSGNNLDAAAQRTLSAAAQERGREFALSL